VLSLLGAGGFSRQAAQILAKTHQSGILRFSGLLFRAVLRLTLFCDDAVLRLTLFCDDAVL